AVIIHAVKPRLTYYFVAFQYQLAGEFVDTFPASYPDGEPHRIRRPGFRKGWHDGWNGGRYSGWDSQ
ncbi:hypothetical protein LIZ31_19115, partial [Eggerthella lenta]|nr:hypothetical protein [Eggerthella lenta]